MAVKSPKTPIKQSSPLSADFLEEIGHKLLGEKERLERELNILDKDNGPQGSVFPDYGDKEDENAAEVAEFEANMTIEQDLERSLRDIASALERVSNGTYGVCKYCQKPIDERRLRARPTSSSCVECKKTIVQEA